jgi:hypothetical protein
LYKCKNMPTVLKIGSLIFFFTSYDCSEPIHIHVIDGNKECKYWLKEDKKVILADNSGFSKVELQKIKVIVLENYELIITKWNEHCKDAPTKEYKKKR